MATLIYISLLEIFAYNATANYQQFRGRSMTIKNITGLLGGVGYTIYYITLICSFWQFEWWQPIIAYIASMVLGGISALVFQRTLVGVMITPILVIIFAILSIVGVA